MSDIAPDNVFIQPAESLLGAADSLLVTRHDGTDTVTLELDGSDTGSATAKVQKFLDMIKGGLTPKAAAKKIGESLTTLTTLDKDIGARVEALIKNNTLNKGVRIKMVEAALNKILMDNVDSKDPKAQKLALEAGRLISAQEGGHVETGISVNIGVLGETLKGISIPGLENEEE